MSFAHAGARINTQMFETKKISPIEPEPATLISDEKKGR